MTIAVAAEIDERSERGVWSDAAVWRELFAAIAGGSHDALASLYDLSVDRIHGLALWRTGNREDAADVVQATFLRVAEHRDRLTAVRDPRWWLLAVAHRLAIDHARRRRRRATVGLDACAELVAAQPDHAAALDAGRARRLLGRLPARQRAVVYLHHFAEMTFAEIGASLGIPTFTAASRYRLALARLRRLMGGAT